MIIVGLGIKQRWQKKKNLFQCANIYLIEIQSKGRKKNTWTIFSMLCLVFTKYGGSLRPNTSTLSSSVHIVPDRLFLFSHLLFVLSWTLIFKMVWAVGPEMQFLSFLAFLSTIWPWDEFSRKSAPETMAANFYVFRCE